MPYTLSAVLVAELSSSDSPVERDLSTLLGASPNLSAQEALRLQRYHRKVDVARKVMAAYDERIERAASDVEISSKGYLALALIFVAAAAPTAQPADQLRWLNSAYNCMDHVTSPEEIASARVLRGDIDAQLDAAA